MNDNIMNIMEWELRYKRLQHALKSIGTRPPDPPEPMEPQSLISFPVMVNDDLGAMAFYNEKSVTHSFYEAKDSSDQKFLLHNHGKSFENLYSDIPDSNGFCGSK